ncbi:MAG: hypothetical protein HY791_14445 [Deltaproteobacteria bacterium]|nr:hypothetical protein [Deltaproteobacteria bacterium]
MIRRFLASILMFAVTLSAFPWEVLPPGQLEGSLAVLAPPGSHPCPESVPQGGDPCGGGCLCPCCPAHALAPPVVDVEVGARPAGQRSDLGPRAEDLNPSDIAQRIFHPPRQA